VWFTRRYREVIDGLPMFRSRIKTLYQTNTYKKIALITIVKQLLFKEINMEKKFENKSLAQIVKELTQKRKNISIDGANLTISEIISVSRFQTQISFTKDKKVLQLIDETFEHMMKDVEAGTPIYGCNTGYGARASHIVSEGNPKERIDQARRISEGISHVDVSVGPLFKKDVIRAAMLIRINMLMKGVSAVKIQDLDKYREVLNKGITPVVNQYGGIGASGDLAHNSRVLSAMRQLPGTYATDSSGNTDEASKILTEAGITPLKIDPKAGLGLVNGDNFSTALTLLLAVDTANALLLANIVGAMMVEVLKGSDRSFHPLLGEVRAHPGQQEVSKLYRYLLTDSKLSYQEMKGHKSRPIGIKVQDSYSLRCISQYHGVNVDKIKQILDTITINANSASDNPLWVPPNQVTNDEEPWQWVSGGNFIAMHMVECADSLRKVMTQIVKLNDRHLSRLVNPHENNGLSPNLSSHEAITQCAFKGVQIQSGMFEVYSMMLSMPVSTMFGVHEEMNQDITSHALTSGILGLENLRLTRYSIAQNLIAVAQAVDLRGGENNLSSKTRPVYKYIRDRVKLVTKERPLHNDIEKIYEDIKNGELMKVILKKVLNNYN